MKRSIQWIKTGKWILFVLIFCFTANLYGQQQNVSGTVSDASTGETIPGVNILVKGTTTGTSTDNNGNYELTVPSLQDTLIFSFIGYESQEVAIDGRTTVGVSLAPRTIMGEEMVVVGYGTQRQRDVTGSISSISSEEIAQRPITSLEQALQGLEPGLNFAERYASPGQLSTISIRGIGSISAGFSPLFVVDGVPTDQRSAAAINPADVESVDILKDASSTAIYGSRGANGVIIITTKSGRGGDSRINVNVSNGISHIPERSRVDVLNGEEFVQFYTESFSNRGLPIPDAIKNWDGTDTDWQDEVYRSAPFQNYSISATGGSEEVSYLLSGNFINEEGVLPGEGLDKFSARLKVDYRPSDRVTIGMNIAPNYSVIQRGSPVGSIIAPANSLVALLPPILPVRNPDGSYANGGDLGFGFPLANPLELAEQWDEERELFRMLTSMNVSVDILEGLTVKSSIAANLGTNKSQTFYDAPGSRFGLSNVNFLSVSQSQQTDWLNENIVNYMETLGNDHSFDLLAGITFEKNRGESILGRVSSFDIIGPTVLAFGDSETITAGNGISENTLLSYLGRLNYSFKERYLLTATVRRDGSSRFGAKNRFGTFGSFAVGWRFSEESFVENLDFLSEGKLRVSFGTTGSNAIPNFIARPSLVAVNTSFGSTAVKGVVNGAPGNINLTWEKSQQLDVGLDLTLFDDRISITSDYFRNTTKDLLLQKNLVLSSGFPGVLTNIGSMRNSGIELDINARVIERRDFSWSIGGNVTYMEQEVSDLGGVDEIINFFGVLRTVKGGNLQEIRGVRVIGVVREGDNPPAQPGAQPGDILFEDADGNGTIGNFLSGDGQLLGSSPHLDWIYGITTNVNYKNFELSALLQGQAGGEVFDQYLATLGSELFNTNVSKEFWFDGRYISESQPGDGKTPRAGALILSGNGAGAVSSLVVQSTDFLRIRNVTFRYNFPSDQLSNYGLRNLSLFISVENLHTFTNFIGGNPQATRISAGGPGLIGGSRLVGDGLELGLNSTPSLPLPTIWTGGINFTF